jgi:hypothetical protein
VFSSKQGEAWISIFRARYRSRFKNELNAWLFLLGKTSEHGTELSCSLPEFEFRPSEAFRVKVGQKMRFDVVNQLDLLLQERGLMADALVVEAVSDSCKTSVIWLRYDPQKLSDHGISNCTLCADDSDTVFNGVVFCVTENECNGSETMKRR